MAGRTHAAQPVNRSVIPTVTKGLAAAAFTLLLAGTAPAQAQRVFHVDFAGGNDAADGTTPATAWKRAPGDPLATANARAIRLEPGDRVLFKGGVRYRGTINLSRSGQEGQPIIYDGSGWGSSRAIMDGSDILGNSQPCPSQAACLGSEHWRSLRMAPLPSGAIWSDWLFSADEALQLSQWPAIRSYWDYDDKDQMAVIPKATLNQLKAGFIAVPGVPQRLRTGQPILGLWHNLNDISISSSFSITPAGINYHQPAYHPYTDRDNRFTIYNAPSEVDAPGKFALSPPDGIAIFWPKAGRETAPVAIGTRRPGFLVGSVSHVRIRGFSFANFTSDNHEGKTNVQSGSAIMGTSPSNHVEVHDNQFRAMVSFTRMGAVRLARANNVDIRRNHFENLPWGTAIYVSNGEGPANISCNTINRVGRNGVRILNNMHVNIEGNFIENIYGIHGAGINLYLDVRLPVVRNNVVRNAHRPMTIQGHSGNPYFTDPTPPDVRIEKNQLISTSINGAAISSWGKQIRNVRIESNLLAGPRNALRFTGGEHNISVVNNRIIGKILMPSGQQLADNSGNQMLAADGNGLLLTENSGPPRLSGCYPESTAQRTTSSRLSAR